jgi:hypothetical protein
MSGHLATGCVGCKASCATVAAFDCPCHHEWCQFSEPADGQFVHRSPSSLFLSLQAIASGNATAAATAISQALATGSANGQNALAAALAISLASGDADAAAQALSQAAAQGTNATALSTAIATSTGGKVRPTLSITQSQ